MSRTDILCWDIGEACPVIKRKYSIEVFARVINIKNLSYVLEHFSIAIMAESYKKIYKDKIRTYSSAWSDYGTGIDDSLIT